MKIPTSSLALLLSLNLLFFSVVIACDDHPSPPSPKPKPTPKPSPKPSPPSPSNSYYPSPPKQYPSPPTSYPSRLKSYPSPPKAETCPINALKLGVCANVLGGLLGVKVGIITPPKEECCSLIQGLVDVEAAVCLCTAIKADVLGIRLDVPISLSLLLNVCDKRIPPGYQCA